MQQQEFTEEQKQMAMDHQKLDMERKTIMQKLIEIGEEEREHTLVTETLAKLDDDKKCWRLINGVLVEKTKKELLPELEGVIENMKALIKQLNDRALQIRDSMRKIEEEIGQNIQKPSEEIKETEASGRSSGGVLA